MNDHNLLLGTEHGVRLLNHEEAGWRVAAEGLLDFKIWAVAGRPNQPGTYLAGAYGQGLFCSDDHAVTWQKCSDGLKHGYIRSIAFDPQNPRTVYVGTEPAAIFRSDDGGQTWRELDAIQQLPGAHTWSLPYSPRRGAIRTIAIERSRPMVIYAGIEQGGVILSRDGGNSWQMLHSGVHRDVHQLAISPVNPSQVFAATGGGLYRTDDGGRYWMRLLPRYIRAVWINPENPACIWAGPAEHVGREGTILESPDSGMNWQQVTAGLQSPMPDMVESFTGPLGKSLLAVTSGGHFLCSDRENPKWSELLPLPGLHVTVAALV